MSIKIEENIWIEMSDGCKLSARIWMPEDAENNPVPAILEYIPYRKRDGTRDRDEPMHGYFAQQGYVAIRVDMRGSGESDGIMYDEYLSQEQKDALEVIDWLSRQPWCSGNVGMMGKSWGGFNCLQVAALQPPALKAVLPVCFTDNRFTDDVHYMGGCLLNDNLWWGSIMMAFQARAIDPELIEDDWRARWHERLNELPHFQQIWLEHQTYDDYWKHGSICEDYSAVKVPVLAVSGWADSYTNAVFRVLEKLSGPRLGIVGPWAHIYPHDGTPTPAIGFLQEAVRFWDQFLKGRETGIMDEPMLRAYVEAPHKPTGTRHEATGRWVAESAWPSAEIAERVLYFAANGCLTDQAQEQSELSIRSPISTGKSSGDWMGAGCDGDRPGDQRVDDAGSLVFNSDIITDDFELLGAPILKLTLASDSPVAQICVRINDVHPDGHIARVSYQLLNLTHRKSHENPEPLEPGRFEDITIKLNDCGHRFEKGHRVRISISTAYWPIAWPAPYDATLTLRTRMSTLSLPVRKNTAGGDEVSFLPPVHGPETPVTLIKAGTLSRHATQDLITGDNSYIAHGEGGVFGEGVFRFDDVDLLVDHSLTREMFINDNDPLSAKGKIVQSFTLGRKGWMTRIDITTHMSCDLDNFYLEAELDAFEDDKLVSHREWKEVIHRNLV